MRRRRRCCSSTSTCTVSTSPRRCVFVRASVRVLGVDRVVSLHLAVSRECALQLQQRSCEQVPSQCKSAHI